MRDPRNIPIQLLPHRLHLSIIQKMTMVQVYRLRRTCKQMNNFITSIQSQCSNYTNSTLCVYLSDFSLTNNVNGLIYIRRGHLNRRSPYCFCFSSSLMGQLAGARFCSIFLQKNGSRHQRMLFQKHSRPVHILNILITLNLQCEEIHYEEIGAIPWDIVRLIRFTSIYAKSSTCTTEIFSEIKQRRIDVFRVARLTALINDYDITFQNFRTVSIKELDPEPRHSTLVRYLQKILETKDHGRLKKLSIPSNINEVGLLDEFPWKQIYSTPVGPVPGRQSERNNCLVLLINLSEEEVILIISKETTNSRNQTTARCKISFTRNDKIKVTRKVLHCFMKECQKNDKKLVEQTIQAIASKEWEDQQDFYQQLLETLKYKFYF